MKKTMALFTIAGLSMASEFDGVADNDLHLYKLQNGITALVHTVDDELRVLPIDYHPRPRPTGPIMADDELRVLPINYHPSGSNRPHVVYTDDDEFRILPIDHPVRPNPRPNKPIMADDDEFRSLPFDYIHSTKFGGPRTVFADDDELRVLPIDYHPGSSNGPRVIYADDNDDELRVLPINYHPSGSNRPHVVYTDDNDDEFRILPIDYHPPRSTPNRPIRADDDDEFRVVSSAYTHALSKYGKDKKPVPQEATQNDDELRLIGVGAGSLTHKKNVTETAKPVEVKPKRFTTGSAKLNVKEADDADNELHLYKLQNGITALVHTVDDELRVLPIDYRSSGSNRPHVVYTDDDEFRIMGIDYPTRPVPHRPIMAADDDELRLIAVGPGSLTHKKNVTETAKPVEVKPKRFTTGAEKLQKNISTNAADDEMRFAHFIPQYRPKREDVEAKAVDNTLLELSDLLVESQRNGGFLRKGR